MINTRKELEQKLDRLSSEQLNSVCQFVEFLEYKKEPTPKNSLTNQDIEQIFASYRQQKKQRIASFAKNDTIVSEELSEPLSDEFLDLFEP